MKKFPEFILVLVVVAVVAWALGPSRSTSEPPISAASPRSPAPRQTKLAKSAQVGWGLNGVHVGETLTQLEQRKGPPDFRWPERGAQQWERPLTRVDFDSRGVVTKVEGAGPVTRDGRQVFPYGATDQELVEILGEPDERPEPAKLIYPGLELWCGSTTTGSNVYRLSHITLTPEDQ